MNSVDILSKQRPNTLFIHKRAELTLNYLTKITDPEQEYRPYFENKMLPNPTLKHHRWDHVDCTSRFIQAFIFARQMSGNQKGIEVELALKKYLLVSFERGDGSCCLVPPDEKHYLLYEVPYLIMWDQSRALHALTTWYLVAGPDKELVKKYTYKLINGLKSKAFIEQDLAYFTGDLWHEGIWEKTGQGGECPGGQIIAPLVRFYEATQDEDVLDFALKLAKGVLAGKGMFFNYNTGYPGGFREDGSFEGHFHSHSTTVAGILRLGIVAEQKNYVEWAKMVYHWIMTNQKGKGSSFGWFPEHIVYLEDGGCSKTDSETCCTTDMIEIACLLARAGYTEYWEDAERFVSNYLTEVQITSLKPYEQYFQGTGSNYQANMEIARRMQGGFIACVYPNDRYIHIKGWGLDPFNVHMMGCCPPAGVNGLYFIWSNIITREKGKVYVNMLLNRNSKWVEIISYMPYQGKIAVVVKDAPTVYIKVPGWTSQNKIKTWVNDKLVPTVWNDDYVIFDNNQPGNILTVCFPVRKIWIKDTIGGNNLNVACSKGQQEYNVKWRGNTVTGIIPAGERLPMFQRDFMETDEVPITTEKSFYYPAEEIKF